MSFFESDYAPTDADLQDWIHVLQLNEAEDFGPTDEMLINWQEEQDYRDEGDWSDEPDDDMDGDATSALESVYGPEDYYPD